MTIQFAHANNVSHLNHFSPSKQRRAWEKAKMRKALKLKLRLALLEYSNQFVLENGMKMKWTKAKKAWEREREKWTKLSSIGARTDFPNPNYVLSPEYYTTYKTPRVIISKSNPHITFPFPISLPRTSPSSAYQINMPVRVGIGGSILGRGHDMTRQGWALSTAWFSSFII